jgi:hypothetical protein
MVGSRDRGVMIDNQVEGWPGYVIDEVAKKAELSIPLLPNIVLLNAGTNDMKDNDDPTNAHTRLGKLVDRLLSAIPDTVVIVSTLLPNKDNATEARIEAYNSQLVGMVNNRSEAGKKVLLVDMHSSCFSTKDLNDSTHPTDKGYLKMAGVFYDGIQNASRRNWITAPHRTNISDSVPGTPAACNSPVGNSNCSINIQLCSSSASRSHVCDISSTGVFSLTVISLFPWMLWRLA